VGPWKLACECQTQNIPIALGVSTPARIRTVNDRRDRSERPADQESKDASFCKPHHPILNYLSGSIAGKIRGPVFGISADEVEITDGLHAGEAVVVAGVRDVYRAEIRLVL
jgi:hypothetical protein